MTTNQATRHPAHTVAVLPTLPTCDICRADISARRIRPARYDAKTAMGPWAFMCEAHYLIYRAHGQLGLGLGQALETEEEHGQHAGA